jgi:glycosyltransferase involved in cell wall biosynthesis
MDSQAAVRERRSGNEPLRITYVGRLVESKGVFETVEAVRLLRDRSIVVSLEIAGTGPAEEALKRRVAGAGLNDRVRFVGAVFGKNKDMVWERSDIFSFPTYHREGLPYALLESMAAGCVPVASPVGAIPDVMQNEVQGLFVPSEDAASLADSIERLSNDRELLHRMAQCSRQRICDTYTVSRLAADFVALYEKLA